MPSFEIPSLARRSYNNAFLMWRKFPTYVPEDRNFGKLRHIVEPGF